MAEEKELELEDVALDDGGGESSKKVIIMIAAGALLLIGLSVGLTLFLLGDDAPDEEESAAAEEAAPKEVVKLEYVQLKPFTVNFQQGSRTRLLQVQLSISTRNEATVDALKTHAPLIEHTIITLLGGREFETLRTTEGKEDLRMALKDAIQEVTQQEAGGAGVEDVLFTRFVMQ